MRSLRHAAAVLIAPVLASGGIGCVTRSIGPDSTQIEAGLKIAARERAMGLAPASSFYTNAQSAPPPQSLVALVVPRSVVEAQPQKIKADNFYTGITLNAVETNPTRLVVESMAAYLDDHAEVEIVPDVNAVSPGVTLVLEPVVDSIEWRYNGFLAFRIEANLHLTLRDHTNGQEESLGSGWVTGGTYWTTTNTGLANRVVRAVAHATAIVLEKANAVARLSSP